MVTGPQERSGVDAAKETDAEGFGGKPTRSGRGEKRL